MEMVNTELPSVREQDKNLWIWKLYVYFTDKADRKRNRVYSDDDDYDPDQENKRRRKGGSREDEDIDDDEEDSDYEGGKVC